MPLVEESPLYGTGAVLLSIAPPKRAGTFIQEVVSCLFTALPADPSEQEISERSMPVAAKAATRGVLFRKSIFMGLQFIGVNGMPKTRSVMFMQIYNYQFADVHKITPSLRQLLYLILRPLPL